MANRDKVIDGFRAVAVTAVVYAHAVGYRFGNLDWLHYPQRLADPLAELGVQVFFVISGYIITSLLLREEAKTGSVNRLAFYIRRIFRIIPPFAILILFAPADWSSKAYAATFTCNVAECRWGVAHSWSLAVEEQFYLVWPMLFVALRKHRTPFLITSLAALTIAFLLQPPTFHSNAASFANIAMGALAAVQPTWRLGGRYWAWLLVGLALVLGPLTPFALVVATLNPLLIAYLIFGAYDLALVRRVLESVPFQWMGGASYSLYLWQQPFLGKDSTWPLWLFPLAVASSVFLVERPFNKLGHLLSTRAIRRQRLPMACQG